MGFLPDDWTAVFLPEAPLLELVVRGSVLYFAILVLMRVMPRRTGGQLATMDLVFIVLIANAGAQAIGDYSALADAVVVIATLMAWNVVVNAVSYRNRLVEKLVSAAPLQVVRDGRMLRRHMRQEWLTEEELMSHLRELGIEDLAEVKAAYVEGEGKLTAVRRKKSGSQQPAPQPHSSVP